MEPTPGQRFYEAWFQHFDPHIFEREPMQRWPELPEELREGYEVAAAAVSRSTGSATR